MFFLVTGASGVGKSTVRRQLTKSFRDVLIAAELATLGHTSAELATLGHAPAWTLRWRHQMVERAVQRALEAQERGKHFLLCGDPVPPGELYAAPSADRLDGIAVCLLDASAQAQRERLLARGDDSALLPHHLAFAEWMRAHVLDHRHRPEVLLQDAWEEMRWERWMRDDLARPLWEASIIDTTDLRPSAVGAQVAAWIRTALSP